MNIPDSSNLESQLEMTREIQNILVNMLTIQEESMMKGIKILNQSRGNERHIKTTSHLYNQLQKPMET